MAAVGQVITVGTSATLIFEVVDGITYAGLTSPAANIFKGADSNRPLPILLVFPASTALYLGGSGVTTGTGANIDGVISLSYNCVGGDSLYGIVGSSTAAVQLLVMGQ